MSEHNHNHDCECGHDHEHEEEATVIMSLEDGTEMECAVVSIFPVNDKQYIALLPVDQVDSEEGEVFLYRFNQLEGDEIDLQNIEDDDEYEAVADAFDELLDEDEFDELFDEDEE